MEFRLLGRLEVVEGDRSLPLGGSRQRALLALLLLHRNEPVPLDAIVDALWGERPPKTAAHVVRVYVSQLRKVLESGRAESEPQLLVTEGRGYSVHVDPALVDADRFELLRTEGSRLLAAGEAVAAAEVLREALALWRGPPLPELAYEPFAEVELARLRELRLTTLEDFGDAALAAGRDSDLVADLEHLVAAHPLRERPRAQLMLALYRSGRQADALETYQRGRRALVDELGLEPGDALRSLEARIHRRDPALACGTTPAAEREIAPPPTPPRRSRRLALAIAVAGLAAAGLAGALGFVIFSGGGDGSTPPRRSAYRIALVNPGPPPAPGTEVPVIMDPIAGLRRAAREVGVRTRQYWNGQYEAAARNSDLVLVGATTDVERVATVIREFPRTRFVVGERVVGKASPFASERNVTGLAFADREVGYLAGYLAGLTAKPDGTVSVVGGLPVPSVVDLITGFRSGVRRAHRRVRVLVGYSGSFDDQSACERVANREISHGSTIVFDAAGACGFGALQAAGIRGVWGIGVDSDLSYLGPQILASAVKRVDRATELAVTLFAEGSLPAARDLRLDLATDSVGLAGISDRVPDSVRARVEALAGSLRARDQALPH